MRRSISGLMAAVLAATFLASGCDAPPAGAPGELLLSWSFADGRDCTEAAVPTVYVGPPAGDTYTRLDCPAGLGQPVSAGRFPPGPLEVLAQSVSGATLYQGRATMPATDPAVVTVVLVFVAGAAGP